MKDVEVHYYASLREQAGTQKELISAAGRSAASLYEQLREQHAFDLRGSQVQVAINDRFAQMDDVLQAGDQVVFIPPVAGG